MTKERKQANLTKKLSLFFFTLLIINVSLKISGFSTFDTNYALNASHAMADKIIYFGVPSLFLVLGVWFAKLSKTKSVEAESVEVSGCYW